MEGTKVVTMLPTKHLTLRLHNKNHLSNNDQGHSENNKQIYNSTESKEKRRINKNKYPRRSRRAEVRTKAVEEERTKNVDTEEHYQETSNIVVDGCNEKENKHPTCSGRKDVLILSTPDDREAVEEITEELLHLGSRISVDIFDDIHLGKPEYESIKLAREQYHIALIYVSHRFTEDRIRLDQAYNLLYPSFETSQSVIPIFEKNSNTSCFPSIKGIRLENQKSVLLYLIEKQVIALRR